MNKVILIGNLTRAPELRTTTTGVSVCNFTLAVNRRVPNAQGVREADFISIVAWRQLAELCSRYLDKGRKCAVFGQMQTRSYEGQDGVRKFITEVVADEVEFLDRPPMGAAPADGESRYAPNQYQGSDAAPKEAPSSFMGEGFVDVDDDELPF